MLVVMETKSPLGPGFRALFLGFFVSNVGDGIRLAAIPLLADSLTSSPLLIASVTVAQYLPWITFAPVGGAMVDRWDRRRIILVTQGWRGLVVAGLALLVWTSHVEIWHVCLVAFVITVGEILVDPSTVALIPTLVDDDNLDRANGRITGVEVATNDFAGGPVGAALFTFAPWLPFLIDGVTYLGSLLPYRKLPRNPPRLPAGDTGRAGSLKTDALEGFRWLRSHEVLGPLTVAQVVYYFGFSANLSLLVFLIRDELEGSRAAFGIVLAIGAVGAFLGTFIGTSVAARLGPRRSLSGAVALQAVTLGAAAIAPSVAVLAGLWFLNGIPAGAQRPIARSLQQRLTPNELLGRINVTVRIFTRGVIVVGALFAGVVATVSGVRLSFALGGLAQLVAAAMMWSALGRAPLARGRQS